jgi:pimeloyl-ACP methyl ester carboxylesterase
LRPDNRIESPCRPSGRRRKRSTGANLSRICAVVGHEFIVGAALDDATVIEHDDVELARSPKVGRVPLVCQDWGDLVGLRLLAAQPERFDRLVVANTFLPVGDRPPSEAFMAWREYSVEGARAHRKADADDIQRLRRGDAFTPTHVG